MAKTSTGKNPTADVKSYRDLIGRPQHLDVSFEIEDREAAIDVDKRTVDMSILSEEPIQQWWFGRVILDHKKTAVRMDRMNAGAPLLLNHRTDQQIGVLENVRIKDGKLRATARFSRSALAEEIFQDVRDGIRRNTSGGFVIHEIKLEKKKDGEPDTYRALDWEPFEGSIASIPADISVGAGRSLDDPDENEEETETAATRTAKTPSTERIKPMKTPEEEAAEAAAAALAARTPAQLLQARTTEFIDTAALFGETEEQKTRFRATARKLALDDAATIDTLKRDILASMKESQAPLVPVPADRAGAIQFGYASKPRHFKGERAAEKAYRFGQWFRAACLGDVGAQTWCRDNGVLLQRAQQEGVNEKGGFLVPPEFGNDMIDLREEFGVFRRLAKIVPMASDTRSDPRRTGGLTAYFVGESDPGTVSDKTWDRITLTARKLMCMARLSTEISEDSVVSLGDDLAGEMAYAFANKEDDCGFNGDGSSPYGGIVGVRAALLGLSGTIANIAGLVVATGTGYATSYAATVLKDFHKVKGRLPQYALRRGPKWIMHQSYWSEIVESLMIASGGVTSLEIAAGAPPRLLGYPVEISQIMPSVPAVSQVVALFGVLDMAASFGDRRSTTIAVSEHSRFANDEIEIRGTERFDINVHDVGNASATAGLRVPGPVVGLITAAS